MKTFTQLLEKRSYSKFIEYKYDDPNKNIIYNYVLGLISGINDNLRSNDTKTDADIIKAMDDAFESNLAVNKKIDVYRTVTWDYMKNIYNISNINIEDAVGKKITNKGFMSTTSIKKSPWMDSWSDDECVMHITSDKNVKYIDVNKIFKKSEIDSYFQKEILLPRNMKLEIISVEPIDDTYMFNMKLL